MTIPLWLIYALGAAVMAAMTGIFAKLGTKELDTTFATTLRACIGVLYLLFICTWLNKWHHMRFVEWRGIFWITLAGIAGASSWLFGYAALAHGGPVSKVAALDKLSVPIAVVLAVLLLRETLTPVNWSGVALIVIGAFLVALK